MALRTPVPTSFRVSSGTELKCPICDEERRSYLFIVRGLPVVQCPGCGLISLNPVPSTADVQGFYRDFDDVADPRLIWKDGETERDAVEYYLALLRDRAVCSGRLLVIAPPDHRFALDASKRGYEIGLHQSIADVDDREGFEKGAFDAAVVLYQLEKSNSPRETLRKVHESLVPNGTILIATPTLDSWAVRFFGDRWTEWRPENRYYFSGSLIQSFLLKYGFVEIDVQSDRRLYTLRHVRDRAAAFPRTSLTRLIGFAYRVMPPICRDLRIRITSSGMIVTATKSEPRPRPLCSIIVPAFNEKKTFTTVIETLLLKQLAGADKEIIVVESNSSDGTREAAQSYEMHPDVKLVLQDKPRGKGNAVREGFRHATGDIILIQDADLEYDFNDYDSLLEPLLTNRAAFVLGARHGGSWKMRSFANQQGISTMLNLGHLFFTGLINVLYGQRMGDPFTMFKVFRRDCLYGLEFERNRFDFDHELVIKLVQKGYRPLELPVNYQSRSFKEGKKVSVLRDPLLWLWVDFKYRFAPVRRTQRK